jgi:hypothetical protein
VAHEKPDYHSIPLDEPRPLSHKERSLVEFLLTSPAAVPELHEQARHALVSEVCSCGCPSVTFAVPDDAPTARLDPDHPDVRHGHDISIEAEATGPDGRPLDVILHILGGRLFELEVWAGMYGRDPATELPNTDTLHFE